MFDKKQKHICIWELGVFTPYTAATVEHVETKLKLSTMNII